VSALAVSLLAGAKPAKNNLKEIQKKQQEDKKKAAEGVRLTIWPVPRVSLLLCPLLG
jgi:hypothetical protein